jgi:hypothetical protein
VVGIVVYRKYGCGGRKIARMMYGSEEEELEIMCGRGMVRWKRAGETSKP